MNNKWINTQLGHDVRSNVQVNAVQGSSHVLTGHTPTSHVLAAGLRDAYATSGMPGHVFVASGTAVGTRVLEGGLFLRPRLERADAVLPGTGLSSTEREGVERKDADHRGFEGGFLGSPLTGSTGLAAALASAARGTSDRTTSLSIQQSRDLVPIG